MERENEINVLLKSLLGEAKDAIGDNRYSNDSNKVLKSAKDILKISKQIEGYIIELNKIIIAKG